MKRFYKSKIYFVILFMGILLSCNDDLNNNVVYITAAESTPIMNFSAKGTGDDIGITVSSSLIVEQDVEVVLSIENSLVDEYNKKYNESYKALKEGTCSLSENNITLTKGNYRTSAITLTVNDIEKVEKGTNYLLPVKLISKNKDYQALPGSDVLYIVINRTILQNVPKFSGTNCLKVEFKNNDLTRLQNLDAFTIEARVNLWEFPKYYGGNLMGIIGFPASTSAWLFVDGTPDRVGGEGNIPVFMLGAEQWTVYAGKLGFTVERDNWYHIAGVYENNTLKLYINGVLFDESEYNKKISFTDKFYIGGSPGVQNGFYIKGAISEARLWTRALTMTELRNPLHQCFVSSDSEGLEGYWKLNDGNKSFIDYSGNGHDAVSIGTDPIDVMEDVPCPS